MNREKYLKDVLKSYDAEMKGIMTATTPDEVSYHERKIRTLLTELQLAIPMLAEDIMEASRQRRDKLMRED